jgi:hypothetical protein
MEGSNPVLDMEVVLTADMADFTGLGTSTLTLREVCLWLNSYVDAHGLTNGDLPLLGGKYPGPQIKFDECLNYLFGPYFSECGVKEGEAVEYSVFKSLCLKHMRFVPPTEKDE